MFYIYELDENYFVTSTGSIEEKEEEKEKYKHEFSFLVDKMPFSGKEFFNGNGIPKYKLIDGELIEATHPDTEMILLNKEKEEILKFLFDTDYVVIKLQENQLVPFLSEEEVISYTNILTNRQGKRQRMTQIDIELGE